MPNLDAINHFLQTELSKRGLREVSAVEAAQWLESAGLLRDSRHRQGKPLRDLLRRGAVKSAYQRDGRFWFISNVGIGALSFSKVVVASPTPERLEVGAHVLPDVLSQGLRIVFVGTAAGDRSAARRAYYAGSGNRFWATLSEIGLTPRRFEPSEFPLLLEHGIGLTDIAKSTHGMDSRLKHEDYDVCGFLVKMRLFSPRLVAFNGKLAASKCYGCSTGALSYGRQPGALESAVAYVLPSTSGTAGGYWDVIYWRELAAAMEAR